MQRIILVIIIVLLGWNILITLNLVEIKKQNVDTKTVTVIKENSTEFETNFSKIIENTQGKVVSVVCETNHSKTYGSGFVYGKSEDNGVYIITSANLLNNANEVSVYFANKERIEATIEKRDNFSNIAILKIYPSFNVESFVLGNSDLVNEGDWILSIGNNYNINYENDYREGIISSINKINKKDIDNDGDFDYDCPQYETTALIDNSFIGGVVCNLNQEVIGMITINNSNSSSFVPISEIKRVVNSYLETKEIERASLGIIVKDIKELPSYLKSYYHIDLTIESGLLVVEYAENSNFIVGDIITKIDDVEVGYSEYRDWIYNHNDESLIEFIRDNETNTIRIINNDQNN